MKVSVTKRFKRKSLPGLMLNAADNNSEEESEADEDSEGEDCDNCSDFSE